MIRPGGAKDASVVRCCDWLRSCKGDQSSAGANINVSQTLLGRQPATLTQTPTGKTSG